MNDEQNVHEKLGLKEMTKRDPRLAQVGGKYIDILLPPVKNGIFNF